MLGDPYQPPNANPDRNCADDSPVSAVVVEHLRGTRPWVRFCSLAGYITSGFLILIALITLRAMAGRFPVHHLLLLGLFFLILAVLFLIPSLWLSRYEKSITRLTVSNRIEDLEQSIAHQRAFWKQMAIMILVVLVIYLITIAFSAIKLLSSH